MKTKTNLSQMSANEVIKHFNFERMPVEGTLFKNVYRSCKKDSMGRPLGTSIIGMYSHELKSVSCFHRLQCDEIWHFYGGDPIILYLLLPDGAYKTVILGNNILKGELIQFVVPSGVWQAGELISGGNYGLFGCTMAPGFYGPDFEAAIGCELEKEYSQLKEVIKRLSVNGDLTKMPDGYAE